VEHPQKSVAAAVEEGAVALAAAAIMQGRHE
jgi:hypothetical protein